MAKKTNAVRIVEQAGISCREAYYEYVESDLSGTHAAQALGENPEMVYKTLVARGDRTGINVFCIPVCCELDLKKAARAAGDKHIALIAVKDLLGLTGYIRGGCSPVGMKRKYPTYFEKSCLLFDEIAISAGERGHQMLLNPVELAELVQAEMADLIVYKGEQSHV